MKFAAARTVDGAKQHRNTLILHMECIIGCCAVLCTFRRVALTIVPVVVQCNVHPRIGENAVGHVMVGLVGCDLICAKAEVAQQIIIEGAHT